MSKLRTFSEEHPSVVVLAVLICIILLSGLLLSFVVAIATSIRLDLFHDPICLLNQCVKDYFAEIDQSLSIIKVTVDLSVAIATIGGIFVALLSYFDTSNSTALTNHIEHLKVFREYLESEIKKRERLSSQSIDSLLLYGTIFSQSRNGKTTVSKNYVTFIRALNLIIDESNARCTVGTPGGFSYRDHQRKVRDHLSAAGISVYMAPRNDYFEMEGQLFNLLHRIGQSFCPPDAVPDITNRTYY